MEPEGKEGDEEASEVITFVQDSVRKDIGISKYDKKYKTYLCCYDQTPIALSAESTKIMIDERIMDWYRVHKFLPQEEEARIRSDVSVNEDGFQYTRTQYIHRRCWHILQDPENKVIVELMKEKALITIPVNNKNATIYVYNRKPHDETRLCEYGDGILDEWHNGFRYILFDDLSTSRYLHYRCYEKLKSDQQKKPRMMNPLEDFNTPPKKPPRDQWNLELLRHKVEEWIDFFGRFIMTDAQIQYFYESLTDITDVIKVIVDNAVKASWLIELDRIFGLTEDEKNFVENGTEDERKAELKRLQNILDSYPRQSAESTAKIHRFYNVIQFTSFIRNRVK